MCYLAREHDHAAAVHARGKRCPKIEAPLALLRKQLALVLALVPELAQQQMKMAQA